MSSATLLDGSIMAMIAIALVFDDDEREPGGTAGPEAEPSPLSANGRVGVG
jgi:hypothetical protein